jgi:hypothetical protein
LDSTTLVVPHPSRVSFPYRNTSALWGNQCGRGKSGRKHGSVRRSAVWESSKGNAACVDKSSTVYCRAVTARCLLLPNGERTEPVRSATWRWTQPGLISGCSQLSAALHSVRTPDIRRCFANGTLVRTPDDGCVREVRHLQPRESRASDDIRQRAISSIACGSQDSLSCGLWQQRLWLHTVDVVQKTWTPP